MPERYAIISDIHSNLEALTAVLADIDRRGIPTIYCLGDLVGYGPDPEACVDIVRQRCERTVRGNHDDALFTGPERFNVFAREAIRFTRERLRPKLLRGRHATERWEWLRGLPQHVRVGDALLVHGSPNDPVNEYVYQEDVFFSADTKLKGIFDQTDLVTFCGHTHLPVIITSQLETFVPRDGANEYALTPTRKYIVNVGSVGQPRDRDVRSCYVEVEGPLVRHHRIPYDWKITKAKIERISALDEILGIRLGRGM